MIYNKNADLFMFLSTQCKEPDQNNHMREVERLKLFYFSAPNKARFFKDNDVLYINCRSGYGCTFTINVKCPKSDNP